MKAQVSQLFIQYPTIECLTYWDLINECHNNECLNDNHFTREHLINERLTDLCPTK